MARVWKGWQLTTSICQLCMIKKHSAWRAQGNHRLKIQKKVLVNDDLFSPTYQGCARTTNDEQEQKKHEVNTDYSHTMS